LGGEGREEGGGEGVGAPFNVLPPGATDLVAPLGGGFSKFRLAWRRAEFFSGGGCAAWCRLAPEFGG